MVDGRRSPAWLAVLYQRGLSVEQAIESFEFMYVNFWDRRKDGHGLDELLTIQAEMLRDSKY